MNLFETTFKRLEKHFISNDCAFISACRSENTATENNKATEDLAFDLQVLGYGFIKIIGHYVETNKNTGEKIPVKEKSFAVFNNNAEDKYKTNFKRDMLILCKKYDQECILMKLKNESGHYYYKDGHIARNFNRISKENIEDFYTQLRNTKFVCTESDETDNKEDYSLVNKNFWAKQHRYVTLKTFQMLYPELFSEDSCE